jgi:hypothetical protein
MLIKKENSRHESDELTQQLATLRLASSTGEGNQQGGGQRKA